jgi:monoamine oxidase
MKAEVLIIGAGAAGLSAANYLKQRNVSVLVLEARDRLGGRIYSKFDKKINSWVELGAEFIHGSPDQIFNRSKQYNLKTLRIRDRHYVYENSKLVETKDFWKKLEEVIGVLTRNFNKKGSIGEFISSESPSTEIKIAKNYFENFYAANLDLLGQQEAVLSENTGEDDKGMLVFRDGYSRILSTIILETPKENPYILLNQEVEKIDWSPNEIGVYTHTQGLFNAEKILITVPISVLKNKNIQFSPEIKIDPKLDLIEMGSALRITLIFNQKVWKKALPQGGFVHSFSELEFKTWWAFEKNNFYYVTAWVGGTSATKLSSYPEETLKTEVLRELALILSLSSNELPNALESWYFHNWELDKFSQGAYTYLRADATDHVRPEPIEGTIFFAGEGWAKNADRGTVQGAIKSGIDAAKEILKSLEPRKKQI